jgi:hypothetical protein
VTVPTLFAANESQVLVAGNAVEGVRSIDYRRVQARENVYGLGSHERIGLVGGSSRACCVWPPPRRRWMR